jgi:phosphoribosylaminoimidazole carboxylase (NCAIR synthetase)
VESLRKQTSIRNLGHVELAFTLNIREWYQLQGSVKVACAEKIQQLKNARQRAEAWVKPLEKDLESSLELIKKIDVMLYEFEEAEQVKLDEQPKWLQQRARNPVSGSYGSSFK